MTQADIDHFFAQPADFDWGPVQPSRRHLVARALLLAALTIAVAATAAVILWAYRTR